MCYINIARKNYTKPVWKLIKLEQVYQTYVYILLPPRTGFDSCQDRLKQQHVGQSSPIETDYEITKVQITSKHKIMTSAYKITPRINVLLSQSRSLLNLQQRKGVSDCCKKSITKSRKNSNKIGNDLKETHYLHYSNIKLLKYCVALSRTNWE